jgi:hypothetical protein
MNDCQLINKIVLLINDYQKSLLQPFQIQLKFDGIIAKLEVGLKQGEHLL